MTDIFCDNSSLSALAEIEFEDALSRLKATGFRLSQALIDEARAEVERKTGA